MNIWTELDYVLTYTPPPGKFITLESLTMAGPSAFELTGMLVTCSSRTDMVVFVVHI